MLVFNLPSLARLGTVFLVAHIGAAFANSIHNDVPRDTMRLEGLEYSPPHITSENSHRVFMSFELPDASGQRLTLVLTRDEDVFSQPLAVRHLTADGSESSVDVIPPGSHLVFRGITTLAEPPSDDDDERRSNLHSSLAGWARMTLFVKEGQEILGEGAFSFNGVEYHVQPDYAYRQTQSPHDPDMSAESQTPYLIAWKESSAESPDGQELRRRQEGSSPQCFVSGLDVEQRQLKASVHFEELLGRQSGGLGSLDLSQFIGSTVGCPTSRQTALLGIATDCTYTARFNSSTALREHVLATVNSASQLYEQSFNISLRVQNLTISDEACPGNAGSTSTPWNQACSSSTTLADRLGLMSTWASTQADDGNAVWSLLTACNSGSTVGIAYTGTVCNTGNSRFRSTGGVNVVVGTTRGEWQILAHEIGHNFGAVHDCTSDCNSSSERCCPFSQSSCDAGGRYIMNPASSSSQTQFSPCTIGTICTALGRNLVRKSCLSGNDNVTTISSGVCGNGIVEPGEECDCGGEEGCGSNSRCCNPTTCSFVDNAVCDPSNDGCCTAQCQVSGSGSVCRASTGACDPQEVCNGSSASCPPDLTTPDGQSCGNGSNGTTTCASGQCTSRDLQCSVALSNSSNPLVGVSACNSNSCRMSCSTGDAQSSSSSCQAPGVDFLDGTPCANGRLCYGGECRGSSPGSNSASSWISRNRTVFIVIVVLGGIAVIGAAWCCIACVRRRSRQRKESRNATRLAALQRRPQMATATVAAGPNVLLPSNSHHASNGEYGGFYTRGAPGTQPVVPPPPPSRVPTYRYA